MTSELLTSLNEELTKLIEIEKVYFCGKKASKKLFDGYEILQQKKRTIQKELEELTT